MSPRFQFNDKITHKRYGNGVVWSCDNITLIARFPDKWGDMYFNMDPNSVDPMTDDIPHSCPILARIQARAEELKDNNLMADVCIVRSINDRLRKENKGLKEEVNSIIGAAYAAEDADDFCLWVRTLKKHKDALP